MMMTHTMMMYLQGVDPGGGFTRAPGTGSTPCLVAVVAGRAQAAAEARLGAGASPQRGTTTTTTPAITGKKRRAAEMDSKEIGGGGGGGGGGDRRQKRRRRSFSDSR
jgi:hypothetical protein